MQLAEILKKPDLCIDKDTLDHYYNLANEQLPSWIDVSQAKDKEKWIEEAFDEAFDVANDYFEEAIEENPNIPIMQLARRELLKYYVVNLAELFLSYFQEQTMAIEIEFETYLQ